MYTKYIYYMSPLTSTTYLTVMAIINIYTIRAFSLMI